MWEIVEHGYEAHYQSLLERVYEKTISTAECREIAHIMDMHLALRVSYERLNDKSGIEEHTIKFMGFSARTSHCEITYMVKHRQEEARMQKMVNLGRQNEEILPKARAWCKHLQIVMTSSGMLADMSGLPVGSHDITCSHAKNGCGGMNLPWILPEFLVEHCKGCTFHAPNGDTEWGLQVLGNREKQRKAIEERQCQQRVQLDEVRAQSRAIQHQARQQADLTVHRVLELTEQLFDDDPSRSAAASALLQEAAKVAADLFHPAAVDVILNSAIQPALSEL